MIDDKKRRGFECRKLSLALIRQGISAIRPSRII
jgi:hypothetical protein